MKKKVGELYDKPIVIGNPNEFTKNEIALSDLGGGDKNNTPKCYKFILPLQLDTGEELPILGRIINDFRSIEIFTYNGVPIKGPVVGLCYDENNNHYRYDFDLTMEYCNLVLDNPSNGYVLFDNVYNREIYCMLPDSEYVGLDKIYSGGKFNIDTYNLKLSIDRYCVPVSYEEYLSKVMDTKIYSIEEINK